MLTVAMPPQNVNGFSDQGDPVGAGPIRVGGGVYVLRQCADGGEGILERSEVGVTLDGSPSDSGYQVCELDWVRAKSLWGPEGVEGQEGEAVTEADSGGSGVEDKAVDEVTADTVEAVSKPDEPSGGVGTGGDGGLYFDGHDAPIGRFQDQVYLRTVSISVVVEPSSAVVPRQLLLYLLSKY